MPLTSHTRRASVPLIEFEEDDTRANVAQMQADLAKSIVQGLSKPCPKKSSSKADGQTDDYTFTKSIPTVVLYDEKGLSLYSDITEEPDYYPFETERELLLRHGDEIAQRMFPFLAPASAPHQPQVNGDHEDNKQQAHPKQQQDKDNSVWGDFESGKHNYGINGALGDDSPRGFIVELGAGNLKKTGVLLDSLSRLAKKHPGPNKPHTAYYAVDLEKEELAVTLEALVATQPEAVSTNGNGAQHDHRVEVSGINASYDQLKPNLGPEAGLFTSQAPKSFWWLGSSIGNEDFQGAVDFLKSFSDKLSPGDTFLIGIDSTKVGSDVELAYGDRHHITESFILNGMDAVSRLLEKAGYTDTKNFSADAFEYVHRFNAEGGCHEAYVRAKNDISCKGPHGSFHIHQGELLRIERSFKFNSSQIAQFWDQSGLRLVNSWHHDRHDYGLYLCEKPPFHFPSTELQIQSGVNPFSVPSLEDWSSLWKAWDTVTMGMIPEELLHSKPIDLRHKNLFYLGHIPAFLQIHLSKHFKEPFTEPARFAELFERGIDPHVDDPDQCHDHSEVPDKDEDWPTLQEIVDYRDAVRQRLRAVYESGRLESEGKDSRRLARVLCMVFEHEAMHLETLLYMLVQIGDQVNAPPGFHQPDWAALKAVSDRQALMEESAAAVIEYPAQTVRLGQDDKDLEDDKHPFNSKQALGWDNENGARDVKVDAFKIASQPITNGQYLGFLKQRKFEEGLIPPLWQRLSSDSFGVRVVYDPGYVEFGVAERWPVQASYNQLAAYAEYKNARLPTEPELRIFLSNNPQDHPTANTGFKNWHPVAPRPATQDHPASNGGVWEWTSTNFEAYEGFSSSALYPGYSSDFFDGSHNVILGGSWATIPRISGRPTFRNWFQKNYPYVFCGARLVVN